MSEKTGKSPRSTIILVALTVGFAVLSAHLMRVNLQKSAKITDMELELAMAEEAPQEVVLKVAPAAASKTEELEGKLSEARRESAELRQILGEKDQEIADLGKESTSVTVRSRGDQRQDGKEKRTMSSWMEKIREEDPARFEEIQKRIQEMNVRRTEGLENQVDFIVGIDAERLTDEQLENHTLLLKKLETLRDLNARMQNPGEDDDPGAVRQQMREEMGGVRELLDKERSIVIDQFAKDLGYDDKGAAEFSKYIDQAYQNTSMRSVMGWSGGSSRGGRGDRPPQGNR